LTAEAFLRSVALAKDLAKAVSEALVIP